jgi:hypothetical protein
LRLLTAQEVAQSYRAGIGSALRDIGDRSGLVSVWHFDNDFRDAYGTNPPLTNNGGAHFVIGKR